MNALLNCFTFPAVCLGALMRNHVSLDLLTLKDIRGRCSPLAGPQTIHCCRACKFYGSVKGSPVNVTYLPRNEGEDRQRELLLAQPEGGAARAVVSLPGKGGGGVLGLGFMKSATCPLR